MMGSEFATVNRRNRMSFLSRREFVGAGLAASANLFHPDVMTRAEDKPKRDVHQRILDLAARQQEERRKRFAAVTTKADLEALQKALRQKFLELLDGLPERAGTPPARSLGKIDGDDYTIDKLVFESFPGYFVPALLYKPKKLDGKRPGIIGPCGHSPVGKANASYQTLHINLVKRGYVVLTYDPVGQGERSQYWDADKGRSRYNLGCGEHAVMGNPLYLLGTSLARYRIHDGMRAIDYLAALPEVDAERIGCIGNSGGGTLTAYIAALDPRVKVAVPSCYITSLPRRMGNRIQRDPESDPEQDIFGFVSEGIDHAGLLALRAPRPTQVNAAKLDFFPIEGARESFAEVKKLYEVAGAAEQLALAEADEKHGLSLPLRKAAYVWFDRWLAGVKEPHGDEIAVKPRPTKELQVTPDGQVNVSLKSRPLMPLALELFRKQPKRAKVPLKDLLRVAEEQRESRAEGAANVGRKDATIVLCINGNESRAWEEEKDFVARLMAKDVFVMHTVPQGVGSLRPALEVKGRDYADPLIGVEENIAYNAFLTGRSLLGMRVADVVATVAAFAKGSKPKRIVLCGCRDSALVALFAAAIEPAVTHLAIEEMPLSYLPLFEPDARPINAASIVPKLLRDFGDIPDVLGAVAPRPVLTAACLGKLDPPMTSVRTSEKRFTADPQLFLDWLGR
jgi:dienelactone hydrolase